MTALKQLSALAMEAPTRAPRCRRLTTRGPGGTLTATGPGITGKLKQTLQPTNPIEALIATARHPP
jgi:hypothetical protein